MKENKQIKPLISIIVATRNEEKNLPTLLRSIKKQSYVHWEIIVVDNYSTDATTTLAKKFTNKIYLQGPERSPQRNYGARHAQGDYLLFLDADMQLPKNTLKECVQLISQQNARAIILPETVNANNFYGQVKKLEKKLYEGYQYVESPRCIQKKLFLQIHGYDDDLVAGEDWDLAEKIRSKSHIFRIHTAIILHEDFLKSEFANKLYYSRKIKNYWKRYPQLKIHQAGIFRVALFWEKRKLLCTHPLAALALIGLKSAQYLLYLIA